MTFPHTDLRSFLEVLDKHGELHRIHAEVDPHLEVTEITDRVSKQRPPGPALLFDKPSRGSGMPLLINALGSERRMELALGVDNLTDLTAKVEAVLAMIEEKPEGLIGQLKMLPKLKSLGDFFPKVQKGAAPCQEVVKTGDQVDLYELPVLQCWPQDAGPFITMPGVFSHDPETGRRNCGMYRMQVYDRRTTGMHWHQHHHGAHHHRVATRTGRKRLEVAAALGGDPCTLWSAAAPLPDDVDEMLLAGFLREKPVPMVQCRTVDVQVPANAEIVLEGYVETGELRREGPFGDHTGYYSLADDYPVFHVTAVTHRRDPIYQTIIVGRPPQEDCWMALAIEHLFLPLMRKQLPEVVDYHLPFEGIFHNMMIVALDKRYPGHARKVMHAIWGLGQAMFTKVIVVVDADVNVRDMGEVAWKALNHIDPERDTEFVLGPVETLDHASRLPKFGSKMGVDATTKTREEGFEREWPDEIVMDEDTRRRVDDLWDRLGLDRD